MQISSFVAGAFCLALSMQAHATLDDDRISHMSLRRKIGQVMVWAYSGSQMSPEIQRTLTKYQPGALIVFRKNIKSPLQIAKLNADLQHKMKSIGAPPLFLMIDQEGGLVTRVRTKTPMPSALALSKMENVFVEKYARSTADFLFSLGFNFDLAPVLDISDPDEDSFIGNRAFGDDPEIVGRQTLAYARGLSAGGMIPTAKHFPGHGGTLEDSHRGTPSKSSTLEELQSHDLIPFADFTGGDFLKAIMIAHMALPKVDSSGLPATYSKLVIQERLRQGLAYDGLILTDDLEMAGAAGTHSESIGERAVRAFLAGNDLLMVSGVKASQKAVFDAMLSAVQRGRISRHRLNESVMRILQAKSRLNDPPAPSQRRINETLNALDALSQEVMKSNFRTAVNEMTARWPEVNNDSHVLVFSNSAAFFKQFTQRFKGKTKSYLLTPTSLKAVATALSTMSSDFALFFATGSQTAHYLNSLSPDLRAKLVVINCNHSGEIENQDDFLAVLNINSYFPESAVWTADLLNEPVNPRSPATSHHQKKED